jgi:hypothetical protein
MKISLLLLALFCALVLTSSSAPLSTNAAGFAGKERAVVKFAQPVQLMDVTLQGEYLFVHDDAAMARGESCTFDYKGVNESANKLVASFHCMPAFRNKAAYFTVRTAPNSRGLLELVEYQFAGSMEAHIVPAGPHVEHVAISPVN